MSIVILSAVFPPEPLVSAAISFDLASTLAAQGHEVLVICPRPSRAGIAGQSFEGREAIQMESGFKVLRLPSYASVRPTVLGRARESWSFGWRAIVAVARHAPRAKVIYANVWPIFAQAILSIYARQLRVPLLLHIQDAYPEALRSKVSGRLWPLLRRLLLELDTFNASGAEVCIVISPDMHDLYRRTRHIPAHRLSLVRNWLMNEPAPLPAIREAAASQYGVPRGKFTFLYLGNIGPVAGVDQLLLAFEATKSEGAQLVIAGSGSERGRCLEIAARMRNRAVHFIEDNSPESTAAILSLADVFLLPMRPGTGSGSVPSKLIAYLAMGRPVLALADDPSDTKKCILDARCGWVGSPGAVEWLGRKMSEISMLDTDSLCEMGRNGMAFGREAFSREKSLRRLVDLFTSPGAVNVAAVL